MEHRTGGAFLGRSFLLWSRRHAESVQAYGDGGEQIRDAAAVLGVGVMAAAWPAQALEVGDTVVLPSLTLLDGKTLPASAFKDRTVIVEYWTSWCPFCAQQNPHVQKLYEATRGKPIQIVTLSIDKKPQEAVDYMKAHGYTFPAGMERPAAIGCPPKRVRRSRQEETASNSEKPSTLLPEPRASPPEREITMQGLPKRSTMRAATMPITP